MTCRRLLFAAAAALVMAAAGPAFAQDAAASAAPPVEQAVDPADPFAEGQDPFDVSAFDQTVAQGTEQDKKSGLEVQFGGNMLFDASAAVTADFDGYTAGGSFSGKGFVKVSVPDYGAAYVGYNFSKNIFQGKGGTGVSVPRGALDSASWELSEFHLSFDVARAVFFRIGSQLLAWGPSQVWTPVDFVNRERLDPLATFDLRTGKAGVRATVPLGISNVFLFVDLADTVTATAVNDLFDTARLAARWDITLLGFEFAFTGYLGSSIQNKYGFDLSGRLLGFDVYGELAMAFPYSSYDFSYAYALGLQRTFGELSYWTASAEFFANSEGTADTAAYPAKVFAGAFNPFYVGQYYTYAALTRTHLGMDGVSATLAGFMDISDASFLLRLSTSIDVAKVVPFTFSLSWAGGGTGRAFTYFTGNNAFSADLRVSFSF
jgi:hypothetical protein